MIPRPFWRSRPEKEVDDEFAAHIELQTIRYIQSGMSEPAARARALERFGDTDRVRSECTTIQHRMEARMRRTEYFEELKQDIHFTFRSLRKSRLFTLVALLTVAIGVGANTAIFSVIDAVLLKSPPYEHASRVVVINNRYGVNGENSAAVSAPEYFDYQARLKSIDLIAAIRPRTWPLTGNGSEAEVLNVYQVTPNFFQLLGVNASIGRTFREGDGVPGGELTVVLTHALWERRFGADTAIVGQSISINSLPHVVVGVMPPDIRFPDDPLGYLKAKADVWTSSNLAAVNTPQNRGNQNLVVIARKKAGTTDAMVRNELAVLMDEYKREYPDRYGRDPGKWRITSVTLQDETVGAVRPVLLLFGGAVGFVLLIACVNLANLLIARGSLRQREFAVRLALGAGRGRLLRQLMTESVMLSVGGGLIGVAVAFPGVKGLSRIQPGNIPRLEDASVNLNTLLFAMGLSVVTGLVIGILPALQQSGLGLAKTINESSRGASDGRGRRRVRTALVVVEVAMALVLLNGAGLLGRSFMQLQRIKPGFDAGNAMTMYVNLPRARYDSAFKIANFHEELQSKLSAIPGAIKVGGIYPLPMAGEGWSGSFEIEGQVLAAGAPEPHAQFAAAMPGYFAAMGIQLVAGRDFTGQDRLGQPMVAVIDEDLARTYWPNESPLGKRINADAADGTFETIVGVVRHVRSSSPAETGEGQLYLPYLQHPQGMIYSVVRSSVLPQSLSQPMRDAVRSLDVNLPVSKLMSVDDILFKALARQRFNLIMIGLLALVALTLASVGLYGVMSYLVTQRAKEIGIRMALGGQAAHVRWLVVRESLTIAGAGLIVGTAVSLAMSGAIARLLYGIQPTDITTYASIAVLLLVVSALAAFGPVRRATRVAPLEVLRES